MYYFSCKLVYRKPRRAKLFYSFTANIIYPIIKYINLKLLISIIAMKATLVSEFVTRRNFIHTKIQSVTTLIHVHNLNIKQYKFF